MEESAAKRRKISPSTRAAGNEDDGPASSGSERRRSAGPQRPSFASPTVSSIARGNPDVLDRRNSARAERLTGTFAEDDELQGGAPSAAPPRSQAEGASETEPMSDRRFVRSGAAGPRLSSPTRSLQGGMAAKPRRTLIKPSPRPLPRPGPQEEELLDPFKGRMLRRSPPTGVLPRIEHKEPDLPPTPTEKGISDPSEIPSSSSGIHNTPSKRPRRSRALAERLKSSPLKQSPLRASDLAKSNSSALTLPARRVPSMRAAKKATASPSRPTANRTGAGVKLRRKPHAFRRVKEYDPLSNQKAVRDSLLAEIAQLKEDVVEVAREHERINDEPDRPQNTEALLDILRRHCLRLADEVAPDAVTDWLEAALNPISFLPFGNSRMSIPIPLLQRPEVEEKDEKPPISHHPIPMTKEEELPYLQLFSPLTLTSSLGILPREPPSPNGTPSPIVQKHSISVASEPPGLFAARIEMVVNTKSFAIFELSVPQLERAAIAEIGPFIQGMLENPSSSATRRNICIITWAMAEWTRLASKRAQLWNALDREVRKYDTMAEWARKLRDARGNRSTDEEEEEDDAEDRPKATRTDLLPHLGRTTFHIDLDSDGPGNGLGLRVEWKIGFDWTGEGQSKLGVVLQAPSRWRANDDRQSLMDIPDMFDKLVRNTKDPLDAVRTVVALLVGQE